MKRPVDWLEEDLLGLIQNTAEEGTHLEFKNARALQNADGSKTEISKDVSSFANAAGGVIVYGMDEDPKPPHKATEVSPIDPVEFSKEWLDQVIGSRVQPRIQGLVIHSIDTNLSEPGRVVYVAIVPQSFTAHQAHDKRYYKRFNARSVPMEDYEVGQAMTRFQRPHYELKTSSSSTPSSQDTIAIAFHVGIQNSSELVGHEVSAVLLLPQNLTVNQARFAARGIEVTEGIPHIRVPGDSTITAHPFPAMEYSVRWNEWLV